MVSHPIINLDTDPRTHRRTRRKTLLRVGLPALCIAAIAAALAASLFYVQAANRAEAGRLSRDYLQVLAERVESEVAAYVAPPVESVRALAAALPDDPLGPEGGDIAVRIGTATLTKTPQVAAVFVGLPDGRFLMTRRRETGEIDIKTMGDPGSGARTAVWRMDAADGTPARTERVPDDTFDPTTRPWFVGAARTGTLFWTPLYVFFTDAAPGLTVARPVFAEDGALVAVVGADLRLGALSEFLATLKDQARGYVLIVDEAGRIVASADGASALPDAEGNLRLATTGDLGDPVLSELYDRLRVGGGAQRIMTVDGISYVAAAPSLVGLFGHPWRLLFLAPEDAFVGFVARASRTSLLLAGATLLLALALSGLMTWQALDARRSTRAAEATRRRAEAEAKGLADISAAAAAGPQDPTSLAQRLTDALTAAGVADRVSAWRLAPTGAVLWRLDTRNTAPAEDSGDPHLRRVHSPAYFDTLLENRSVRVADAAADPRTADLWSHSLARTGTLGFASLPLLANGETLGALWLEDPAAGQDHLARCAAGLLAVSLAAARAADTATRPAETAVPPAATGTDGAASASPAPTPSPSFRTARLATRQDSRWQRDLAARRQSGVALSAEIFPQVTVLAARLGDPLTLAETAEDDLLFARLVDALRAAADRHGVPYVKVMANSIVAADGLGGDDGDATARMAAMALDLRESWRDIFRKADRHAAVTLGLDTGPAVGAPVGPGEAPYNLWGEAVEMAQALAETAPPGAVRITDRAVDHLPDTFGRVPRGTFFTEPAGEIALFELRTES